MNLYFNCSKTGAIGRVSQQTFIELKENEVVKCIYSINGVNQIGYMKISGEREIDFTLGVITYYNCQLITL